MKENDQAGKDEALSKLLRVWKPDAQLPPRFQEGVWARIERAEVRTPFRQGLLARIEAALARPALAVAYVVVVVFAGVGAGYWHGEGRATQAESAWRARYVQTVDPYQMPR